MAVWKLNAYKRLEVPGTWKFSAFQIFWIYSVWNILDFFYANQIWIVFVSGQGVGNAAHHFEQFLWVWHCEYNYRSSGEDILELEWMKTYFCCFSAKAVVICFCKCASFGALNQTKFCEITLFVRASWLVQSDHFPRDRSSHFSLIFLSLEAGTSLLYFSVSLSLSFSLSSSPSLSLCLSLSLSLSLSLPPFISFSHSPTFSIFLTHTHTHIVYSKTCLKRPPV